MDFSQVKSLAIPEGSVAKITDSLGTVLWQKPAADEYTYIPSLDIPAGATLDTGVACKSTDYMFVEWAPLAATTYGAVIHAGNTKNMRFYIDGANGVYGKIDWYNQQIWKPVVVGESHQMWMTEQKVFMDGVQKVNMSGVSAFTADTNLIIGGANQPIRLYRVEHGTIADTPERQWYPVVRNSDGVVGLYDQIYDEFLPYGTATT